MMKAVIKRVAGAAAVLGAFATAWYVIRNRVLY